MPSKKKEEIPAVYVCFYIRLKKWLEKNGMVVPMMNLKEMREILQRTKFPHATINETLDEMARLNLIRRLNHISYEILPSKDKKIKKLEQEYPLWS